jgi:predicted ArsR family transcriptional regulator
MHGNDGWVSILEAAQRLGISPATVRRRIKSGVLEGELLNGRRGPEYRVRLPSEATVDSVAEPSDVTDTKPDITQTIASLLSLVERQQTALLDEARSAAGWRAKADALEERLNELRADLERARRPWWRRWLS